MLKATSSDIRDIIESVQTKDWEVMYAWLKSIIRVPYEGDPHMHARRLVWEEVALVAKEVLDEPC